MRVAKNVSAAPTVVPSDKVVEVFLASWVIADIGFSVGLWEKNELLVTWFCLIWFSSCRWDAVELGRERRDAIDATFATRDIVCAKSGPDGIFESSACAMLCSNAQCRNVALCGAKGVTFSMNVPSNVSESALR